MKKRFALLPLMAVTALSLSLAACDDNAANDTAVVTEENSVVIEEPVLESTMPAAVQIEAVSATAYATAEGARTGAVFLTLNNAGNADDMLIGASSDKATMTEIHESFVDEADGTMQMRSVDNVAVPSNGSVELKPGGYHIMLIDLLAPLVEGETFDVTLRFQDSPEIVVPVTVTAPGAAMDHSGHDMDEPAEATAAEEPALEDDMSVETGVEVPADEPVTTEEVPATDETVAE